MTASLSSERALERVCPPGAIELSRHVRVVDGLGQQSVLYHELFGNIALIDREMANVIRNLKVSAPGASELRATFADTFDTLWNSYFLVGSGDEEREIVAQWLAERAAAIPSGHLIEALQITSSNLCNFSCSYCFADVSDERAGRREHIGEGQPNISFELASDSVRKILDLAAKSGRDGIVVKFLGREPLVNWGVIRRLLGEFRDEPIQWSLTTNGSLLTHRIAGDLRDFDVYTVVSVDGPQASNDIFRTFKSGTGTFERVLDKVSFLRAAGASFGISSVLSSASNLDDMKTFSQDAATWGASQIEFALVMQTRLVQIQAQYPSHDHLARKLADLYIHASQFLPVHGDCFDPFLQLISNHKLRSENRIARPLGAGCAASSHQISVEPNGLLYPCRAMATNYGTIRELENALGSTPYRNVAMRTYYNVPACHGCELEGFCQGTCLGASEQAGDVYSVKPEYCEVYRLVTALLLQWWCQSPDLEGSLTAPFTENPETTRSN